jgi:ketosteroid isomerase-like protein
VNVEDPVGRFTRWLTAFGDAWEAGDAAAMAALFVVGATLAPDPFAAPIRGRRAIHAHFAQLMAHTPGVSFSAEVLGVGHTYGVAHWHVSGGVRDLDGIMVCAIDARGRCESLREWWHADSE